MKQIASSKSRRMYTPFKRSLVMVAVAAVLAGVASPGIKMVVSADAYDDQINALKAKNVQNQTSLNGLLSEAGSYQEAISQLQSKIYTLQAAIESNNAKQVDLQNQIVVAQTELDRKKSYLASNVKAMYVDGTPTNIEILATSKNLSEFVDKQEYRTTVQRQLQDTMKKISALQKQLKDQQAEVVRLLGEQKTQAAQLASDQSQQASLLAYNEGQQANYTAQIRANNAQRVSLEAQQAASYARLRGSGGRSAVGSPITYKNMTAPEYCGGGYRYCDYGLDQFVSDPWGFGYARECVHYVLSNLANQGKFIPSFPAGGGNAYSWVPFTTSVGAATLVSNPQPGDVVYMPIAPLGHVGIVDYVNGDGTVHVSQFNFYPGKYNTMDLYITPGIQFLRFHY